MKLWRQIAESGRVELPLAKPLAQGFALWVIIFGEIHNSEKALQPLVHLLIDRLPEVSPQFILSFVNLIRIRVIVIFLHFKSGFGRWMISPDGPWQLLLSVEIERERPGRIADLLKGQGTLMQRWSAELDLFCWFEKGGRARTPSVRSQLRKHRFLSLNCSLEIWFLRTFKLNLSLIFQTGPIDLI